MVNWKNPVDIFGDFSKQTLQNMLFAFLPFEIGTATAGQGFRRALTMGTQPQAGLPGKIADFSVGLDASLSLVGHEAAEILQKTLKMGRQTAGCSLGG